MSLRAIGAGFGRTGTLSLKMALEELGLGPCYHMTETIAHPAHDSMWLALARSETGDWGQVLHGYASTVDWPSTYFWKELAAANPDAKIILGVRDPDDWYASAAATIFARMLEFESLRTDPTAVDPARRRHMEMVNFIVVEKTFGGSLDKRHAIGVFNAHNDEVRRLVPAERLLVHDAGEGWGPLCDFLSVAIPGTPYPKVNSTDDFMSRFPVER